MKLSRVRKILKAEALWDFDLDTEILTACGADLMSDVLAHITEKSLLLTGLTSNQVIRTAEMLDLAAVVFVRGKRPGESIIQIAKSKNIPLLVTDYPMYESCGLLYKEGLRGCSSM